MEFLFNDNFYILLLMDGLKDENNLVRITQNEVADMWGISYPTANKIFNILLDNKLIIRDKKKVGHYYISDEAVDFIERLMESKLWR